MHECKTVTLRTRPLKKNMLSFYLDYYPGYRDKETMKVIRHESLGIYIYANPKNKREQNFNDVMTVSHLERFLTLVGLCEGLGECFLLLV